MQFSILPRANLGNRMLSYMVAQALAERLGGPISINVGLPEWGLVFDAALHDQGQKPGANSIRLHDGDATTLDEMAERITASGAEMVLLDGFNQRFHLLREVAFYRELFPLQELDISPFAEDEIVLNIRAGEVLSAPVSWYPIVPPSFYKTLIERTGYRPVLLGQLDDSAYLREILRLLPQARLIPSAGAMTDFNRLRHARRLCIAVSTFSWLAGWFAEIAEVHYPVLGFQHPFCLPRGTHEAGGVDLTPLGDERYRFHLFPILNAASEAEYLDFTAKLNPLSMPVSGAFMASLSDRARQIRGPAQGLAAAGAWYLKTYPEAAWSMAFGQVDSAKQHYEMLGARFGYHEHAAWRMKARRRPPGGNLALGKPALQSSVSPWSIHRAPAMDAAGAVDGVVDGNYSFHTSLDDVPWWRVDLGAPTRISEIWVFNRDENSTVAERSLLLSVDGGNSEDAYTELFRYESPTPFGGGTGEPLVIILEPPVTVRFVRMRLRRPGILHLEQVEIYG